MLLWFEPSKGKRLFASSPRDTGPEIEKASNYPEAFLSECVTAVESASCCCFGCCSQAARFRLPAADSQPVRHSDSHCRSLHLGRWRQAGSHSAARCSLPSVLRCHSSAG